jgi:phosphoribosylformimino-5-aminoimidazole carboxamide ribotide isomerase
MIHLVDLDGAKAGRPVNLSSIQEIARTVATPLQLAGGIDGPEQLELAFAAGATRAVMPLAPIVESRATLEACLAVAGDWLAVGLDARAERLREYPWRAGSPPSLEGLIEELASAGVRRFVLSHAGSQPDVALLERLVRGSDAEFAVAGGITELGVVAKLRDAGVAGLILGEALLGGVVDYPTALRAAA